MNLDMYPAVEMPEPERPLTWDDLVAVGRQHQTVRTAIILAERGEITREDAMVRCIYVLYNHAGAMHRRCVELMNTRPMAPFVIPKDARV